MALLLQQNLYEGSKLAGFLKEGGFPKEVYRWQAGNRHGFCDMHSVLLLAPRVIESFVGSRAYFYHRASTTSNKRQLPSTEALHYFLGMGY